jgi:tRNA(fMet)-specific endonuclease VapC
MTGRFMPDTNIVIALFASEAAVLDEFSNADEVFLSCVVLGELYYGARKSARTTENLARIDAFATNSVILNCDMDTSREYAIIKEALRAKGKMIPENDIWIAAMALQHGLTLATRDAHFKEVADLLIANW